MIKAIKKNSGVLAIFALLSTGVVALTHALTEDKIIEQKQKNLLKVLNEVIPENKHNNQLQNYCTLFTSQEYLGSDEPQPAYIAMLDEQQTGIAIQAIAPDGYNGKIKLIVGLDNWGTVTGVRILEHSETPGLGDKIELKVSNWIESFTGKRINLYNQSIGEDGYIGATAARLGQAPKSEGWSIKQWAVRKDGGEFDQFTGATITPRAVVKAVKNVSIFYQSNLRYMYQLPLNCGEQND